MEAEEIQAKFSREDYIMLLDLVGTALDRLAVLNPEAKAFVEMAARFEQRLLGAVAEPKAESGSAPGVRLAEKDTLSGEWMPCPEVSAQFQAHEIAEIRDEDFFWDELALRMAEQSLIRRHGSENWENLGELERRTLADAEFEAIASHLTEHGIERMFLVDRDPHG